MHSRCSLPFIFRSLFHLIFHSCGNIVVSVLSSIFFPIDTQFLIPGYSWGNTPLDPEAYVCLIPSAQIHFKHPTAIVLHLKDRLHAAGTCL